MTDNSRDTMGHAVEGVSALALWRSTCSRSCPHAWTAMLAMRTRRDSRSMTMGSIWS